MHSRLLAVTVMAVFVLAGCAASAPKQDKQAEAPAKEEAAAVEQAAAPPVEADEAGKLKAAIKEADDAGREDEALAENLIALADIQSSRGNSYEAEAAYQRAVSVYDKVKGPEDARVARALTKLARFEAAQGKRSMADSSYKRSIDIVEKTSGPKSMELAALLEEYAALLREMNMTTQAARLEGKVRFIRAHNK